MKEVADKFIPLSIKDKARIKDNAKVFIVMQKKLKKYYSSLNIDLGNVSLQKTILIITFGVILDRYSNQLIGKKGSKFRKNDSFTICLKTRILNYFYKPINNVKNRTYNPNYIFSYLSNELITDFYEDLSNIISDDINSFIEILPYVLEVFEYEIQEANLSRDNLNKKSKGIYYTPSDVANYIVENTVKKSLDDFVKNGQYKEVKNIKILDPSCGTGIFLKIALRELLEFYKFINKNNQFNESLSPLEFCLRNNIYGVDKSNTAINSSIFILLISFIDELEHMELSPYELWTLASLNIKAGDATVSPINLPNNTNDIMKDLMRLRSELKEGHRNIETWKEKIALYHNKVSILLEEDCFFDFRLEFPEVFSGMGKGFTCIIGNPPYFRIENKMLFEYQEKKYNSAILSRDSNIYTLFVENMKILSNHFYSHSGLVIPLSISYSEGRASTALREMIAEDEASWELIHFDRSPDSLFGDDIKTRNCIIFRSVNHHGEKVVSTSELLRWNSRNRSELFNNIKVIEINDFEIKDYIPKIGQEIEKVSLKILEGGKRSFFEMLTNVPKSELAKLPESTVYLYSTAYNWIPVFRDVPRSFDKDGNFIITDSLWGVRAENEIEANFIFACLTSKIFYWYWVVRGDLFHLPKKFLKTIKVHKEQFNRDDYILLASLGGSLWKKLQLFPVNKTNAGKTIGNYNPLPSHDIIDKIDSIIINSLNLPQSFNLFLREWHSNLISAGRIEYKNASYIDLEHNLMEV